MAKLDVEPTFDVLPLCSNCLEVYPNPAATLASCRKCSTPPFKTVRSGPTTANRRAPRLQAPFMSIQAQLANLPSVPGVEFEPDKWRKNLDTLPASDIIDGAVTKSLLGPDGTPFFENDGVQFEKGPEGELRVGVTLGLDWFSYLRSQIAPSHSSCPISIGIANLPAHLRYRTANLLLVGIMPGPKEQLPDECQRFLRVLVNELLRLWETGFTAITPSRPLVGGFGSHSHTFFCTRCWISQADKVKPGAFQQNEIWWTMAPDKQNTVTELLHRKRGEQFRHRQNQLRSRSHISSSSPFIRNKPTLPISLSSLYLDDDILYNTGSKTSSSEDLVERQSKCSGPVPPKSWAKAQLTKQDIYLTSTWRSEALSLLYAQLDVRIAEERILPLSVLCLLPLVTGCTTSELRCDVLPYVPQHLRKQVVRYTAVQKPLSSSRLWLLYEEDGHSDGEMIVVGPDVAIRDDYFLQHNQGHMNTLPEEARAPERGFSKRDDEECSGYEDDGADDWENDDNSSKLLTTFAAISTRLPTSTILTLPPTITHLALIRTTAPVALHRLPQTCPLVVFLDLSFNDWLERPTIETEKSLARVDWSRWSQLQTLGWRTYPMPDTLRTRINKGRWDDIAIIQ
ncbi:hypothetical protein NMY22_g68 [Coprinellus aureogranulatus]|nr:hypothetical protein NMY22_g68 [Coprinellus aureogranulatus]